MKFILKDLEVRPDFAIWKSWDKRGDEFKDANGNTMKFPIRDGVLTNNKEEIKQVVDLRFMPNKDFKEQYPNFSRKFSYIRQVIVNSIEYSYRFARTSDNRLKEKIFDLQTMGKDPLKTEFELTYDGSKSASEQYGIKISAVDLQPIQITQTASTYQSPPKQNNRERDIIDAIKSVFGKECSQDRFMDIMKKNGVTDARVVELYQEYKK